MSSSDRVLRIGAARCSPGLWRSLEIDTDRVERSIRGWKLGLNNWLFLGSEDGGQWGAVMFSLIESCKIQGIDPEAYLEDVLVRVSSTPMSQIESLMPRCWHPPPTALTDPHSNIFEKSGYPEGL